ncbi:MAG TPA: VanW family protein [Candidatus Limnocylindrales bacterium]|jgi:vancomycin resistance protein YoaR
MTTALEPTAIDTPTESPADTAVAEPRRRHLLARFVLAFLIGLAAFLALGAGALYAYDQQYAGRILPGVQVGDVNLSGLDADEAAAKLHARYDSLAQGTITIAAGDSTVTVPFSSAGRGPDVDGMVTRALAVGRAGTTVERMIANARTAVRGITIDPAVTYDREKLAAAVDAFATTIDESPTDASVSTGPGRTFTIAPAKEGRAVDQAAVLTTLGQQLAALGAPASITTAAPIVSLAPAVTTASAEAAKAAADRMAADVIVAHASDTWTIPGTRLAPLISFATGVDGRITPVLDESGLDPLLKTLAKTVNRTPRDAGLKLVAGHVVVTGSSHDGRTLDATGMKAAIIGEMGARQAGAAPTPIPAVVKSAAPKLTTADAEALAPKMRMISSFRVYYFVIVNNHWGGNIEAPATKINGTVVPAGTVFDFWKVVGDLHKLPGEGPGNAIEGGKITVTGAFGGGICTTSTTLFNAAFRAGMIPLARQNHNEFINRYPPGLDATVWIIGSTKQTMSFKNDTQYPILITRTVTQDGNRRWLSFKIWSVPNGRVAKVTNTVIKPGPRAIDTVVHDPTKPVGYVFRNNAPADGAKVWVTVSIYDHGKLHWTKRYYSNYPAVNGVTIVGTKT